MIFFLEQSEYASELTEVAGVRVLVHSQEKMPFPEDEGLSVSPARLTYVGINLV